MSSDGSVEVETSHAVRPVVFNLRALFDAEYAYVRRTLVRLGIRAADVDDVCQEVFMRVYEKRELYDARRPIRPWLAAFAYRVSANHRRRVSGAREVAFEPREVPPVRETPEDAAEGAQLRRLLLQALQTLSPERRAVLVMHDLDGFGAPEIAEVVEVPVNTVYSRLREARRQLQSEVERIQGGRS